MKRCKLFIVLFLFIFLIHDSSKIYASEININLQELSKGLTNDDELDTSDINDGSCEEKFTIQEYCNSYQSKLTSNEYLFFTHTNKTAPDIYHYYYGGNIYKDNATLIAYNDDMITKIIPREYFTQTGEYSYFGIEYGFYIKTYLKDNIIEDYNAFGALSKKPAYVSDVFVIDFKYTSPEYIGAIKSTFEFKPLFSARYYTINYSKEDGHTVYLDDSNNDTNVLIKPENNFSYNEIIVSNIYSSVPNYNMSEIDISSKVENSRADYNNTTNELVDNGLFIVEAELKYEDLNIIIDGHSYKTNGSKIKNFYFKIQNEIIGDILMLIVGESIPYSSIITEFGPYVYTLIADDTNDIII